MAYYARLRQPGDDWKLEGKVLTTYIPNQVINKRVNESQIYENVPYINGVIAPKTYGLQVRVLLKCYLKIVGTIYSTIIDNFLSSIFIPLGQTHLATTYLFICQSIVSILDLPK